MSDYYATYRQLFHTVIRARTVRELLAFSGSRTVVTIVIFGLILLGLIVRAGQDIARLQELVDGRNA